MNNPEKLATQVTQDDETKNKNTPQDEGALTNGQSRETGNKVTQDDENKNTIQYVFDPTIRK